MPPIVLTAQVDRDGVVRLTLPTGSAEPGELVCVTVEPLRPPTTQEEWRARVMAMAGLIKDSGFERPPQGELEERDPL